MEGIRLRLLGVVEWVAAAACVLVVLVATASVGREIPIVRPVVPVIAGAAPAVAPPANIHPGAILVPEVVLPDGKRLSVGESAAAVLVLGPRAQVEPTVTERDGDRVRESRTYRYAGLEFVVVTMNDEIIAIFR